MKVLLFGLLLTAVVTVALCKEEKQCPPNQEWTNCGSACPPKCNSPPNQMCTMQCIIGCQCKRGLLLNANGECVTPSQC